MGNTYVFEVEVFRNGTDILIKKIHLLAYNLFQATHIAFDYIHDEESEFQNENVELGSVKRLTQINNIVNLEFILDMMDDNEDEEYDGSEPMELAKQMPEEATISFECECKEKLTIPEQIMFPFIKCPNCDNKILRSEIKTVGGISFYQKSK